ncbi:MAG: hypothetical protein HYU84_08850, partial [Chloroflexi bacterium]|nr:hypothetical protein [Chloroflexota bacterium]
MKRWFGFLILILLAACLSSPSQEVNNSSINPPIERTPKDDVQPTAKPNLPEGDVSSYSFLPLTEADYRGVLNSLNADDPDRQFQISYYRLPKYRVVFRNEFLLKYPTLPDRDSIEWGVVVDDPNAVTFKSTPDMDLMEVFIQERLDAGYGVEEIIAEIEKYGGRVDSFREVKDLVGVGRNGYVFLVRIPDVYYSIASFAIFQLGEKHTVKKIRDWDISAFPSMGRYYNLLNVGDTNHNGVTEVVLQIEEGHSGIPQTWFQDIYLVEWSEQLSGFKGNLIPVFAQTCDNPCEGKWEFNTVDSIDTLLVENYWSTRGECPNLISRRLYHWVGGIYSEWETSILPPDDTLSSECQIAWAETAASIYEHDRVNNFDKGWENDLVVHLLEKSLQNWPEKADEIWGPA